MPLCVTENSSLVFNEEDHSYHLKGVRLPSVTQVINEWTEFEFYGQKYFLNRYNGTIITSERMDNARKIGKAVHRASKLVLENNLDWTALHPELVPYMKSIEKWASDFRVKPLVLETPMCSLRYKYAGTPDFVGHIKNDRFLTVVDFASGTYGMKDVQTAAYEQLVKENLKYRGKVKRYTLSLGDNYFFHPHTKTQDWMLFLHLLNTKRLLNRRRLCSK
jgi:hypothetical protein